MLGDIEVLNFETGGYEFLSYKRSSVHSFNQISFP